MTPRGGLAAPGVAPSPSVAMHARRISVPTPFAVGPVNAYLVEGEPLTLIDCGPLVDDAWEALCAEMAAAGRPVEQVRRLVLTHPHHDHAGLARRVQRASGCRVFAHPVDLERLMGGAEQWRGIAGFLLEVCRRAGAPAELLGELETGLADLGRYAEPIDAVEALGEGDELAFDAGRLRALHTPGHARGALCFWDPADATFFSGDTVIPHISSNAVLEPGGGRFREKTLLRYLETLERIATLGVARVLPGHGEPMGSPDALIRKRLRFHELRARRIRELVGEGAERPWEIAVRLFPEVDASFAFLAVSEVVGHLDLLAARGEVTFEGEDGPWRAGRAGRGRGGDA